MYFLFGFEGNWGVMQAVERLSEWTALGTHLQARLFMGKKRIGNVKMDVSLTSKDSARTVTAQWDSLRYVQCRPYMQATYLTSIDACTVQYMY
jgi:hypothetical protein